MLPSANQSSGLSANAAAGAAVLAKPVYDRAPIPQQQAQINPGQIDPQLLARIALEEELKKKGGGGGGAMFKSPSLFVLYSLSVIGAKMQEMYQAMNAALSSKAAEMQGTTVAQFVAQTMQYVQTLPGKAVNLIMNSPAILANALKAAAKSAAKLAQTLSNSFVNLATVAMSALMSKLLKVFEKEKDIEVDELEEEENLGISFFGMGKPIEEEAGDEGNNGRMIISHIQKVADQINNMLSLKGLRAKLRKKK